MTIEKILALTNGARFYRADLHIHSYGGSHDVKDTTMTPEAIVDTAIAEGLNIIAITDHNEIRNVEPAIKAASGKSLLVIPGVELSTSQGHLLCYFEHLDTLTKFFGRINIVDKNTSTSRCQEAILECLNVVKSLNGFCILAHVDAGSGYEHDNPGFSPHKSDVLCHEALLGIELKFAASEIFYSDQDKDTNRTRIGKERITKLKLGSNQYLARVLNSDAHTLNSLGRNASGLKKVTRIKMDSPSFSALKIALEDSDARIRIEEQLPSEIPQIAGIKLDGGFLNGQEIHFSPNLNCIIGGRGTGKSTTFEVVKCLSGLYSDNKVVDSEIWPSSITYVWLDQAGQQHHLTRQLGEPIQNVQDPQTGPTKFPIECYGQGETEKICKEGQSNPIALLSYLDRFINLQNYKELEEKERQELYRLEQEITKAAKNVELIPQLQQDLTLTQSQLAALEKAKAKDVIELSRNLAQERELRSQIGVKLNEIEDAIDDILPKEMIDNIATLADPSKLTIGSIEFNNILKSSRTFETQFSAFQGKAKTDLSDLKTVVDAELASWVVKEKASLATIDTKRKELEAQNIPLDMTYINQLAKNEATLSSNLNNAKLWQNHHVELQKQYKEAQKRRWQARGRIAMTRSAYAKDASEILKAVLTDIKVSLKFTPSAFSPTADNIIKTALAWKTTQVPRAALMIEQLSLPGLLQAIDKKDKAKIMAVTTAEKAPVFSDSEAERIIMELSKPINRYALERCDVFDLPQIIVTKVTKDITGNNVYSNRDFSRLSLGQQQSVLLALMLSSKSSAPLIIDQPEDNLDGEFIYHSLVPVLRLAKEKRQIIIVTHNANIAVLGDAEQIIVMKSTNEKSAIVGRGSIDDMSTKELACNILEGAKEAFQRRARIYGVN
jgi:ABC-type cobalamin/Fe3+-siderophores transport system ATPase subunit